MKKRLLAMLMSVVMLVSMLPAATVSAGENDPTPSISGNASANQTHFISVSDSTAVQEGRQDSLEDPQSAWVLTNAKYSSQNGSYDYSIRLDEMYTGEEAYKLVSGNQANKTNKTNEAPAEGKQWILFKFYLKNRGEQVFSSSTILDEPFYSRTGEKLTVTKAVLPEDSFGPAEVRVAAGEAESVWIGVLLDKTVGFPYLRLNNGYDNGEKYLWLDTDPLYENKPKSVSEGSASEDEVDERIEDIASPGEGMCYVAFYVDKKRVESNGLVTMKIGDSVSYNWIPDNPEGDFIGWYVFTVEKTADKNSMDKAEGDKPAAVVKETGVKWDKTIPVQGNLRLEAKFSDHKIDNSAAMCAVICLDDLADKSDLWLVKGQKVSSNEAIKTNAKKIVKTIGSAKKTAEAIRAGEATLTLTSGKTINVHVTKPKLLKKQTKMYLGDAPQKVVWDVEPNAHFEKIYWKSSNINIARVSDGMIYAVGKGTATIYAYIGGQKYSTKITVKDADVPNVKLPVNININKSRTIKLKGVKAKKAEWRIVEPNMESIVEVRKSGKVKAYGTPATATLECKYDGKVYYRTIYIEDPKPETDEKLTYVNKKYRLTLDLGEGYVIKTDKKNVAQNILWTSSAPTKVYVDETGLVVGRKENSSATLSTKVNGKTVKIYVTINGKKKPEKDKPAVCLDLRYADVPVIPDDGLDDTGAINAAIQSMQGEFAEKYDHTLYLGPGTYNIGVGKSGNPAFPNDAIHFDYDNSNIKFVMSPNAKLVVKGNSKDDYSIFKFSGNQDKKGSYCENITITGGQICGERDKHNSNGADHQGGHGFRIGSYVRNITIEDMVIKDNNGDGICIGGSVGKTSKINIKDCELKNNRRSNISLVWGSDITIDGCTITNANGHAPMAGINIEPNKRDGKYNCDVKNVTVKNCTVKAAASHLVEATPYSYYFAFLVLDLDSTEFRGTDTSSGITVDNCTFEGDFYNGSGAGMTIKNCKINGDFYDKRHATLENTDISGKKTIK
ncbi:MAG: right-handed parallel beta-helix repeat-containing protein [Lachnospiraceae bacterium]|nr:right-handed parallel beta-helix repeat-containing protein [Lachnospiraceae bacterium]